jgi:hypothetical protein
MSAVFRISTLLFFSFFALGIHAQETGIIYGRITNMAGMPLSYSNVLVQGRPFKTVADTNGNYSLTIPADSSFVILVSHVSIGNYRTNVKVKKGDRKKMNFSIKDLNELGTVEIHKYGDPTVFIESIDPKNLYVQTSVTGDFNTILFTMGAHSNNELSTGYSVRGGNYDENLVYVNDIEVYRPFLVRSGQQEGLSFVNPDMVQSIEFSTGGFEAKYGDKMSSVLDIKYRQPDSFASTVSSSLLGSTFHMEGIGRDSGLANRFTWIIGARQKTSRYILKSLDTKGDYKPSFYDVQSYCTLDLTDTWQADLLTNFSGNKYFLEPLSRQSDFGTVNEALRLSVYFEGQETDAYNTYMGGLSFTNKRGAYKDLILKYIVSAYRAHEQETYDILGEYSLDELETDFGKDNFGQVKFNIGAGGFLEHARNYLDATVYNLEHKGKKIIPRDSLHHVQQLYYWGVKGQHEEINDKISEWKMVDSAGYSLPQSNPNIIELQDVVKSNITLASNRFSAYAQGSWGVVRKDTSEMTFTAGMRANYWDLNEQFLAGPRATFAFKPNWKQRKDSTKKRIDILFKAAAGYYYQPPFYRELRDPYGHINRDVKAQTSIHYVVGSLLNFKAWNRDFKFTSELFYKQLKNLVPYEIDNVRIRYYANNNASGYVAGLDTKLSGEFVKGVDSWVTLSVLQAREDIKDDYYVLNYNKAGELIIPGYTSDDTIASSVTKYPGYIPRPTDQRVNFSLFFQDYIPKFERCKMHMNLLYGSRLPFGPPSYERYKDTLRMPPYRRVDIGFSFDLLNKGTHWDKNGITDSLWTKGSDRDSVNWVKTKKFWKGFESIWLSAEVYNLLAVNNTISYLWIKDVTDRQYAIPNYLSRRLINVRLVVKF